jgi:hypothetical protein
MRPLPRAGGTRFAPDPVAKNKKEKRKIRQESFFFSVSLTANEMRRLAERIRRTHLARISQIWLANLKDGNKSVNTSEQSQLETGC